MAVQFESAARLAALRDKADAVTGESSATLAGAVDALIAGFGAGGGSGIGAVKFIDVDVTVEASTTTAVKYTVDGLEFISSAENPTKWTAFSFDDAYIAFVTPKEITGEATGNEGAVFCKSMRVMYGNATYTASLFNIVTDGNTKWHLYNYGIYNVSLDCTAVTDGKIMGTMSFQVSHGGNSLYAVLAGTYNIQVWYLTDWKWGR